MLQSSNNATTIQQYKEVVQKFQHFLEERAKQKQKQDDKLSIAIKRINLHSLLPTLQSDNHQQKNRISKRLSTLQKNNQINNNIQKSIVTPYSNYVSQFKHGKSQSNLDAFQQLGFLHGLYKCDKLEHQSRYISIKDLNQKQRKQSDECQENHIHLPTLQQPHNEIPRQVSKKHTSKKASHEEILYTNRWERDRGNNVVRIDRFEVDKLTKDVVDYIFNQDIIKIFLKTKSTIIVQYVVGITQGVYYESLINFEEMIQYFTSLQFSYLEFFYIKYAIAQVLINANYNYLFVERALNQFEEYRYLIQKPIPFITQLFDNTFYSTIVKDLMMRLLRSAAYNKFLQTQKFESEQFIMAIKNGLFPYLVGDYVALPLHARIKDVKAEQFRQQTLKPFINSTFVIYVKNILKEYNLEDLYINDVERRLIFPKARSNQMEDSNFPMHYIYSYIQCQNILIPSYDIKALIKVIKIDPIVSESDSTIFEDNLSYLSKFEQIQDDIQPFL